MLGSDLRGILAEEEEILRREQALKSLISLRSRALRESLPERIRRARDSGDWTTLSKAECASLHQQEKNYVRAQIAQLDLQRRQTRVKLGELRRAKARAQRIRAAEAAANKKRR